MFLFALTQTGQVSKAAAAAGIDRSTAYLERRKNPEFAREWETAIQDAAFSLEDEAWRRAREGVSEPIVAGGKIIGVKRRYSDTLLIFLLKGLRPDRYSDNYTIRISPDHMAILRRLGMSPSQLWEEMMQEAANADDHK